MQNYNNNNFEMYKIHPGRIFAKSIMLLLLFFTTPHLKIVGLRYSTVPLHLGTPIEELLFLVTFSGCYMPVVKL